MSDSPPISHQALSSCQAQRRAPRAFALLLAAVVVSAAPAARAALWAGAAKVDVTLRTGPVNDPLYVKALVLSDEKNFAVIVTVDAVAIGEIGPIGNDYLENVRREVQRELKIDPASLLVNASHCHGIVRPDVDRLTVDAIRSAFNALTPVRVGVGTGREDRVMENRRMQLKSGREADVRRAYSLPPDDQVVSVGPIDPEIGVLSFDRMDGNTVAVLYNYAGHPIRGVPSGGNTADVTGFASQVIEDNLPVGAVALFVQGCGGDINPVLYKDVSLPRDARPLGQQLDLFDHKPGLRALHGQELPDSIRQTQRLTGMTSGQKAFPVTASVFDFKRHGRSGAWLSELLPHTAGIVDDLCIVRSMHTEAINHDPAVTFLQTGHQQPG